MFYFHLFAEDMYVMQKIVFNKDESISNREKHNKFLFNMLENENVLAVEVLLGY